MKHGEWATKDPLLIFGFFEKEDKKMKKNAKGVVGAVRVIAEPLAEELGYVLWDVEYVKIGADMYLRITIDSEEGITIDDCEKMHRAIDPLLDEADLIDKAYMLEVSSPGIERDLRREDHYEWAVGETVEIKLYAPVNGTKTVKGELAGFDSTTLTVSVKGNEVSLDRKNVSKAKTVFDFGSNK